jgi:hypothetical protein
VLSDSLKKVRLAETGRAVNVERVVFRPGAFRRVKRGCGSHTVTFRDDEILEGEMWVQPLLPGGGRDHCLSGNGCLSKR